MLYIAIAMLYTAACEYLIYINQETVCIRTALSLVGQHETQLLMYLLDIIMLRYSIFVATFTAHNVVREDLNFT